MGTAWVLHGHCMGTAWALHGHCMGTPLTGALLSRTMVHALMIRTEQYWPEPSVPWEGLEGGAHAQ